MMIERSVWRSGLVLAAAALACASPRPSSESTYALEVVLPGDGVHGLHGLAFDAEDRLYGGAVLVSNIFLIDTGTGEAEVFVPGPEGNADDLDFAPDGRLVWTGFMTGQVNVRNADGSIQVLAEGLPGMNSMAFDPRGRLFATQVFLGDALYEIDLAGEAPPRLIMEGMGGLNGFDFGADGKLYGPLWFKGQIVRVDVDAATLEVLADGFATPAAVNFNSKGELFALDTARGEIVQLDPETGERLQVWPAPAAMDNLAIDSRDRIHISVFPENEIHRLDRDTGELVRLRGTALGLPGDLALWPPNDEEEREEGGEEIYVADAFAVRGVTVPGHQARALARAMESKLEVATGGISASARFVYVANRGAGALQRLERESGEVVDHIDGFEAPAAVYELGDGGLLVAQYDSGELVRRDSDGTIEVVAGGLEGPVAIEGAGEGAVYVACHESGRIARVELDSGAVETVASDLAGVEGFAVGAEGRLYVAEVAAKRIIRVDPETGARETLADELPIGVPALESMPPPGFFTGVVVARDGSVYFSSDVEAALYRLRPL